MLVVGVNSWVTLAEADVYMADKFTASAIWATLTNAIKEQLLITAFRWIRTRTGISPASTNEFVKQAQIELAWYIYNYYPQHQKREALIAQGVKRFQISKFEEDLTQTDLPQIIKDILVDFLQEGGTFPVLERDND